MIKRIVCWFMGHERALTGRRVFYTETDGTEITLHHEYMCQNCNRWVKL